MFSPNAEKYGPENLRIGTLFTQLKSLGFVIEKNCNIQALKISAWQVYKKYRVNTFARQKKFFAKDFLESI